MDFYEKSIIYITGDDVKMENVPKSQCLRCTGTMQTVGVEKKQLGQAGMLTGMWRNILAGSLEVDIHICSKCGRVELYSTRSFGNDDLPTRTCPKCGSVHDFDCPKCPSCKYIY